MARIVILGAGMMGTAFCWPLFDGGHEVRLVGTHLDGKIVEAVRASGVHPKLGLPLPVGIRAYAVAELAEALDGADAVALGVSSAGVAWAARALAPFVRPGLPIAMISKGLAWTGSSLRILPDVFVETLPEPARAGIAPVAVAGPCIAGELARRVPTAVVFTGRDPEQCAGWAERARVDYYHVWTSDDVVGIEICAALKNAYAMGIAFAQGIHAGRGGSPGSIALHNYESAVFAQAIWEMRRLIRVCGANPDEAVWLPGVGDLDVTCNGGRTGRFGHLLGTGLSPAEAVEQMQGATLECLDILATLRVAVGAFGARGLLQAGELPLAEHLAAVALDGAPIDMPFPLFFGGQGRSSTLKRSE